MPPAILGLVPWDATMPAGPQQFLTVVSVVLWLLALWFVISECRRRGDRVPLWAFAGAGLIIVYEPLGDTLASVLYPVHGQIVWINLFGRPIPVFIGVLYFWYMSVPAIYFLRRLERGITRAQLWRMYLTSLSLAIGIEVYGVSVGAWVYYGDHAYRVLGVPLWCPVTYSGFLSTISIGLYLMATRLKRQHHWLILLGLPACMAGGHMVLSLPAAAAMFSTADPRWIWFGATLSIALGLLLVHAMSLIMTKEARP